MISNHEASVLAHTSSNGRYVTDEQAVIDMAKRGLLLDYGPQKLAGDMHYLTLTESGGLALLEWKNAQPKPKPLTRSQRRYRNWLDEDCGLKFGQWLKTLKHRHH